MAGNTLEELRELLRDNRFRVVIAMVKAVHIAEDRSFARISADIIPEGYPIVAEMAWDSVGGDSGFFTLPSKDDLVLVAYTDDNTHSYVIKRLTSVSDRLPVTAITGDSVFKSLANKKIWITSDSRINLSRGDEEPTENLVLGQVLKTFLADELSQISDLSDKVAKHKHIGNLGGATTPPDNASDFEAIKGEIDALKSSPIDDDGILSDISFTEK